MKTNINISNNIIGDEPTQCPAIGGTLHYTLDPENHCTLNKNNAI